MPFLRRRGNMVSESDMRRHTILDTDAPQLPPLPQHFPPQQPQQQHQQEQQLLQQQPQSQDQPKPNSQPQSQPPPQQPQQESLPLPPPQQQEIPRLSVSASNDEVPSGSLAVPAQPDPDLETPARHEPDDPDARPETPPVQEETPKHRRFSILRFRNASDSQLSLRAKQQAEKPPPVPRPPEIITTAPTTDFQVPQKKQSRMRLADRFRRSGELPRNSEDGGGRAMTWKSTRRKTGLEDLASRNRPTLVTFEEPNRPSSSRAPMNGDHHDGPALSLPANRASESSRSDASFGDHLYPTTTAGTAGTAGNSPPVQGSSTSFFRLGRRKPKAPVPMFDLSHLPQKGKPNGVENGAAPSSALGAAQPIIASTSREATPRPPHHGSRPPSSYSTRADSVESSAPEQQPQKPNPTPATALFRPGSTHSGQSSPTRARLQRRGRSSTMSSLGRDSMDGHLDPGTSRTSTSVGRKSFGDLFGLNRLRQNSDLGQRQGTLTPATPGSNTSKNNSLQIAREPIALPEKLEDETPVKYLDRIEDILSRGVIASALSKGSDPFSVAVLRSYMRRFSFFGDPMDMAIRKLLMEAELPKETQQIDRCLQAFANRYHECNPGIYASPDQAYFVAFSLLILHTDVFNKNNKHKMQQPDYLKNTQGEGVGDPILRCFYDNITYTPFIHVEDDLELSSDRLIANRAKRKTLFPGGTPDAAAKRANREPLDPYTLILDGKLDILRPSLKDVMELEDHYNYLGTAKDLNVKELQRTFFRTGVLQIVSARSRPDAFRDEKSAINPAEAAQGVVDIKITKVGLLWRKDAKKKKTRSPWQEWGAILTGAQLYFFRNTTWIKNLMHQYESHVKQGYYGEPITFKPPLPEFKPDGYLPTKEAVALVDSTYRKHKNAFKYARPGAFVEEVLLADNEEEMNDWLAKLNYAAAFTTSGVRMRGVVGGNYEGQSRRGIRRLGSSASAQIIQTPTGEVSIVRGKIDHQEAESIQAQRRQTMMDAVAKSDEEIAVKEQELEVHLRNARHLQILSPIQAKTRDQVLSAAAHMDVKIKWVRMDIWKSRCHRDVLLKDLAEEQRLQGLVPTKNGHEAREASPSRERPPMLEAGSATSVGRRRRRSSAAVSVIQGSAKTPQPEPESPTNDAYQTPPTSATFNPHKHQNSWDSKVSRSKEPTHKKRPGSSSSQSSAEPTFYSPQQHPTPKRGKEDEDTTAEDHHDDVDANERVLLEQAGLLETESHSKIPERKRTGSLSETGDASESRDTPGSIDKQDKTKIRRSLQRTLRESAGHLSHHRSRKGKEAVTGAVSEDPGREDVLTRGTGSFVVHGKKASVINFGSELQQLAPEERLRQRKQDQRDVPASPASVEEDFHEALNNSLLPKERRESAASASTATARSFRELHRKYSSAHASRSPAFRGQLSVPSDGESEAAVSFSEGRRTPLPPIENESGDEEESHVTVVSSTVTSPTLASPQPIRAALAPPPQLGTPIEQEKDAEEKQDDEMRRLPSPPVQAVKA